MAPFSVESWTMWNLIEFKRLEFKYLSKVRSLRWTAGSGSGCRPWRWRISVSRPMSLQSARRSWSDLRRTARERDELARWVTCWLVRASWISLKFRHGLIGASRKLAIYSVKSHVTARLPISCVTAADRPRGGSFHQSLAFHLQRVSTIWLLQVPPVGPGVRTRCLSF